MEKILTQILGKLESMDNRFDNLESRFDSLENRFDKLETRMDSLENRFDKLETRMDNLESRFDKLETRMDNLESRFDKLETRMDNLENRFNTLEVKVDELCSLKPKIEESHQWLEALYKASEFHRADIDNIQTKVAKIEGAMTGAAESLLEPFKKAQ